MKDRGFTLLPIVELNVSISGNIAKNEVIKMKYNGCEMLKNLNSATETIIPINRWVLASISLIYFVFIFKTY